MKLLFTSESVSNGHPDKLADQISDAILDACLTQDPDSKVACEVLISNNLLVISGEITSKAKVDYREEAIRVIKEIGYTSQEIGFDYKSCDVIISVYRQSQDISQGVYEGQGLFNEQGAGDQGMMFGYACDETSELMPLPISLAHQLINRLYTCRMEGDIPYLRPDAKVQVTLEYQDNQPKRIDTIVISTQHDETVQYETLVKDIRSMALDVLPSNLVDNKIKFYINPTLY